MQILIGAALRELGVLTLAGATAPILQKGS